MIIGIMYPGTCTCNFGYSLSMLSFERSCDKSVNCLRTCVDDMLTPAQLFKSTWSMADKEANSIDVFVNLDCL